MHWDQAFAALPLGGGLRVDATDEKLVRLEFVLNPLEKLGPVLLIVGAFETRQVEVKRGKSQNSGVLRGSTRCQQDVKVSQGVGCVYVEVWALGLRYWDGSLSGEKVL